MSISPGGANMSGEGCVREARPGQCECEDRGLCVKELCGRLIALRSTFQGCEFVWQSDGWEYQPATGRF